MSVFLDALTSGRVLLMDGAMGTQLQLAGAQPGERLEEWNLTHPKKVQAIHQAYVDAGAEILLTNTFQAQPARSASKVSAAPLASAAGWSMERSAALCRSAVTLARSASPRWVVGDVGPMPDEPQGVSFPRPEPLLHLAEALAGVDAILLETCSDWSAWQAVDWLPDVRRPILLSLAFRTDKDGRTRSRDGHEPEEVAIEAARHDIAALGVNCGVDQDMARMSATVRRMRKVSALPLFVRPNAGTPIQDKGRWVYPLSPEEMANGLAELLEAGVCMVGGCCGTTPAHIAAFRRVLNGG